MKRVIKSNYNNVFSSSAPYEFVKRVVKRGGNVQSEYESTINKLDSLAGTEYLVKGDDNVSYYRIEKSTDKQYQVTPYVLSTPFTSQGKQYPAKISKHPRGTMRFGKANFCNFIEIPVETVTMEELQNIVDEYNNDIR